MIETRFRSQFAMENRTRLILIGAVAAMLALGGIAFFALRPQPSSVPSVLPPPVPQLMPTLSVQSAFELARAKAREWQNDAKLVGVYDEGQTDDKGNSTIFRVWFSSSSAQKGMGYEVLIRDNAVFEAREIALSHQGGDMPQRGIMTQEEALVYLRQLSGYEAATVETMNLYYEPATQQWSWGIKTSKGELSIDAGRVEK